MADRHQAPPPRRARAGAASRGGGRPEPEQPLIDLIFPLNAQPGAEAGAPAPRAGKAARHKRVGKLRRALRRQSAPSSALLGRPVRRRRVLLGLGTGVVAAGGVASAAGLVTGVIDLTSGGGRRRPNTGVDGLGAAGLAGSPAEAARVAAAATPTWPTPLDRDPELHLLRRATFGPTLVDVVALRQMGVDAWLDRQLNPGELPDPETEQVLAGYPTIAMTTAQIRAVVKEGDWQAMRELGHATLARQLWSSRQLYEVMVDFWANHLNVTNPFDGGWDVRTAYDTTVIRAHALGRFSDMLRASARSPAMLRYLDNARSTRRSVNENYGRELLELHTVGIEAGYSEKDVRHSAYIMTGRGVDGDSDFSYRPERHWTGKVTVLGFTHPNQKASAGLDVGEQYLTYLATHPATARRIAHKLARRFVCDDPPHTLVDRLAQSYIDGGSAIVPLLRTLFRSIEFWMSTGLKTRRPLENVLATARIVGVRPGPKTAEAIEGLYWMTNQLGQAPLNWAPPDGYPDVAEAWGSAHATLGTWNAHRALVQGWHRGVSYPDPESFVGLKPATVGAYLDTISWRLVHQPMVPAHRKALLTFLGAKEGTKVKDIRLGGKIDHLVPLVLDSVYHTLR